MTALFRVVEKAFRGQSGFVSVGGLWRATLSLARSDAHRLTSDSLALRMFIVSTGTEGVKVVEEIELEALQMRMERAHDRSLARSNPLRLPSAIQARALRASQVQQWQRQVIKALA